MQSWSREKRLKLVQTALLVAAFGAPATLVQADSLRQPAFASSPELLRAQIQADVMGALEKNRSAKSFGEYSTSGYTAKDVFSNVRELRDPASWAALCQTLDALPVDSLALFETEIHRPLNEGQLPCAAALHGKLTRFWQENSARLRQHLAQAARKPKSGKALGATEERKVSISESPIVTGTELKPREIALTFNDGPDPNRTPKVLEILKSEGLRATFFHIGERIRARPEIDHRLVDERHTLGTHTFAHIDLNRADLKKAEKQIIMARDEAEAASGVDAPFFRAPYGILSEDLKNILRKRKMPVFLGNIDSQDWKIRDEIALYDHILQAIEKKKGGILVLHENQESTVAILRALIEELKSRGFTFIVYVPSN